MQPELLRLGNGKKWWLTLALGLLGSMGLFSSTLRAESSADSTLGLPRAIELIREEKWQEAEEQLIEVNKNAGRLEAYSRYYLGRVKAGQRQWSQAQEEFTRALSLDPNRELRRHIRRGLSEVAIERRQWNEAQRHLTFLERGWRRSEKYPDILWDLIGVEIRRNRKWMACRWARRLYSDHPSYDKIATWGVDLQAALYNGERLDCVATENDQRRRFRRLQWAGEPDRARAEIELLRQRARGSAVYEADSFLANFLVQEGFVDEAIEVLVRHYSEQQKNLNYLLALGRAAARAGEFPAAVGLYYSAYQLSPRSRQGREALFHSAFLSYQFQDYDGASRRFEEFIQTYPSSGLTRDAQWHRAWIRYLRGDYEGAIAHFERILQWRARSQRAWARHPADKVRYWKGMSYFRMEDFAQAHQIFSRLIEINPHSFYALAARERMGGIPADKIPPHGPSVPLRGLASDREEASEPAYDLAEAEGDPSESEEGLSSDPGQDEEEDLPVVGSDEDLAESEELLMVTAFENPQMQVRFDRANDLVQMGLFDWARWELYEIETRTRNRNYLKTLIHQYERINAFNRSARISQNHFAQRRNRQSFTEALPLWRQAFPQAYAPWVGPESEKHLVPAEFVWSIMKAESYFQPDVVSPVGARGLMQIMPNTGRQVARLAGEENFDVDQLFDPQVNIRLGVRYLSRLSRLFQGSLPLMAAAYNAGPHRVEGWLSSFGSLEMDEFIEHIPFLETRNYVKRVLGHYGVYSQLQLASPGRTPDRVRLEWLAQPLGLPRPERFPARENWDTL